MELEYSNNKVKKAFTDGAYLLKTVGLPRAKAIKLRKDQLEAFQNIRELMMSGIDNPHLLSGNLHGCIGWSVTGNLRIILDLKLEKNEAYGLEIARREKICIKGVTDYHGGKDEWIIY